MGQRQRLAATSCLPPRPQPPRRPAAWPPPPTRARTPSGSSGCRPAVQRRAGGRWVGHRRRQRAGPRLPAVRAQRCSCAAHARQPGARQRMLPPASAPAAAPAHLAVDDVGRADGPVGAEFRGGPVDEGAVCKDDLVPVAGGHACGSQGRGGGRRRRTGSGRRRRSQGGTVRLRQPPSCRARKPTPRLGTSSLLPLPSRLPR